MSTQTVLFELGTEELPAGEYAGMADALASGVASGLEQQGLATGEMTVFATARRLAVLIQSVQERADDTEQEVLGPPVAAAKTDDGSWTPAAMGFAKKQGMSADELQISAPRKVTGSAFVRSRQEPCVLTCCQQWSLRQWKISQSPNACGGAGSATNFCDRYNGWYYSTEQRLLTSLYSD